MTMCLFMLTTELRGEKNVGLKDSEKKHKELFGEKVIS